MRNGETGSICDCCGRYLKPFSTVKIKRERLYPGKTYPRVSSDVRSNNRKIMDLCENCYEKKFGLYEHRL